MARILTGHVTHWACLGCSGSAYTTVCSSSCHYPATSHSHWRGVDQHYTGHNQQPDELYAKELCCTAWGKWWSHQTLTGFQTPPDPPQYSKTAHFRVVFYCGQPKPHLCNNHAVQSASWYATLVRWMYYLGKGEVLSVNRKSLRSLSSSHDKWGQKKSVAFIIFFSIYIYVVVYIWYENVIHFIIWNFMKFIFNTHIKLDKTDLNMN